jgi:hypothetical protein
VSLGLQWLGMRLAGAAVSALFAGLVAWRARRGPSPVLEVLVLGAYAYALWSAALRRRRPAAEESVGKLDFELASLCAVGVVAGVWWVEGGVGGPLWGFAHLGFALVCAFARPLASAATWLVFAGTVAALHAAGQGLHPPAFAPLVLLVGATGVAAWTCVQVHVRQAEKRSRAALERELATLREAARAYRLSSAAEPDGDLALAPRSADECDEPSGEHPLVRSSVDEIASALSSALTLCRAALGARSALVLWLDRGGARLQLRGAAAEGAELLPGPFSPKEGIFAAAL